MDLILCVQFLASISLCVPFLCMTEYDGVEGFTLPIQKVEDVQFDMLEI